jgi:hypothetical protein
MTIFQRSAYAPPMVSGTAFTIRSALTAHGHRVEQTQYVTDEFVVTEVGRSTAVYARGLGGRFLVDRARRELVRIDPAAQRQQVEQIRALLGTLQIVRDDRTVLIDGYCCRSIRVTNENARLVLSIETYCTPIQDLSGSALGFERAFDAAFQPFSVPLRPDEVVIRSTTRALAASFGQSQTLQLVALEPCIDAHLGIEQVLDFTVVTR